MLLRFWPRRRCIVQLRCAAGAGVQAGRRGAQRRSDSLQGQASFKAAVSRTAAFLLRPAGLSLRYLQNMSADCSTVAPFGMQYDFISPSAVARLAITFPILSGDEVFGSSAVARWYLLRALSSVAALSMTPATYKLAPMCFFWQRSLSSLPVKNCACAATMLIKKHIAAAKNLISPLLARWGSSNGWLHARPRGTRSMTVVTANPCSPGIWNNRRRSAVAFGF